MSSPKHACRGGYVTSGLEKPRLAGYERTLSSNFSDVFRGRRRSGCLACCLTIWDKDSDFATL